MDELPMKKWPKKSNDLNENIYSNTNMNYACFVKQKQT